MTHVEGPAAQKRPLNPGSLESRMAEVHELNYDIGPILKGWSYEADDLTVRLIRGDDGREKIQVRLDLGVLQMETEGRPDGRRPYGFESMLDYFEHQAIERSATGDSATNFVLSSDDCDELLREGIQYYHRYVSFFHLGRYELVARDTARNLRLFAFVVAHAGDKTDEWRFDQYRPYVIMMNTRARSMLQLEEDDYDAALGIVDEGIQNILAFLSEYSHQEPEDACPELEFLKHWREKLEEERPLSPTESLEQKLQEAVDSEQYERAAALRDKLDRLRGR